MKKTVVVFTTLLFATVTFADTTPATPSASQNNQNEQNEPSLMDNVKKGWNNFIDFFAGKPTPTDSQETKSPTQNNDKANQPAHAQPSQPTSNQPGVMDNIKKGWNSFINVLAPPSK